MRVLLTGATGFIGGHILRALVRAGHDVTACARDAGEFNERLPAVTAIPCDFAQDTAIGDWIPRLNNIDVVINAVGIIREQGRNTFSALHTEAPIALFDACETKGIKRVIQISALGAGASATSQYHLSKYAADLHLSRSSLDWTILRPSIVYGPGGQSTAFFRALASLPLIPLIGRGNQPVQPVDIDDLVGVVVNTLENSGLSRKILNVVGPAPMPFRRFLSLQRSWLGLGRGRFLSIPYYMALLLAAIAGVLGSKILNRETVAMLQQGNQADVRPQIEATGIRPGSVEQGLAATSATSADRWHAQLFLIAPVLRYAIAFLWIFTGLVSVFGYPVEASYQLLDQVGTPDALKPVALYGAAMLDLLLGIAALIGYRLRLVAGMQIFLMIAYSLILSVSLPAQWLHPFGPVTKNVPLIVATWMMAILSEKR